jgi:endonuclease/exonuclease/phosphatase family metal-dependent hydrolase
MQIKNKRVRLSFLIVYIGIVLAYLLTCLTPFLNPDKFWFIAILGLGFPLLLVLLFISLIVGILFRSKWSFLASIALLISSQQIAVLFSFHTQHEFSFAKKEHSLRLLSWNVSSFREQFQGMDTTKNMGLRNLMMDAVRMQNADILCFQEYFESFAPHLFPANNPVLKKMGFNYHYFTPVHKIVDGKLQGGLCIFSKYPILDSSFYKFNDGGNSEGFSFVDMLFNGQIIRIYNSHLESPRLEKKEYTTWDEVQESKNIAGKIKRAYSLRGLQADTLRKSIDTSKHPVIICGDLNDVPNSYSYFKLKGNLQDAFLKKGLGLGNTFQFISPTLRIDYILTDKRFKIEQFTKLNYKYSDHYPLVMDISFSK